LGIVVRLQWLDDKPGLPGHREMTRSRYSRVASVRASPGSGGLVSLNRQGRRQPNAPGEHGRAHHHSRHAAATC
jgi:hypothetical protein